MDFKVRGLEFKSRRVQNNKKLGGGARSRVRVMDRVRTGGERVALFEKHPAPPPSQKKKWKSHLVRRKLTS